MSEGRSWGSTVLGWFIVREEADGTRIEDLGASAGDVAPFESDAAAGSPQPPAAIVQASPPPAPGGTVPFDEVFDGVGIAPEERDRLKKAADLLHSLPSETPVAVRKQIVEASLKAFGIPIDRIIETGVAQIEALEGYIRAGAADTQQLLQESQQRIRQYEEEIRRIRTVMELRVQEQQAVTTTCNAKKLEVQQVLEFFGQEAVARVVRESPRLHEPDAAPGAGASAAATTES